ncbi:uncharacterized protein LOC112202247 [Rosa chinensis]|uniref:uncharacterized protein LOC112202247 n=1 Tax=Rosa chinensis TaxID=74649 RepID=UPI001AD8A7B8|nr:uncharacterized protein LOC112202247 [Rosa chinensis]
MYGLVALQGDMVQKLIYQIYKNPHPNIVVLTVGAAQMRKDDDYSWNHRVESYKFIWLQMNMRLTGISIESQIHQMVEQRSVGLWNGRLKTVKIRLEVQEIYFSICIRSFVIARNYHALLIELYRIKRSYPWVNNIFLIF